MSDRAGRARTTKLVALGGLLAAGAALLLRTWPSPAPAAQDPAAKPVTVDHAPLAQTSRTTPPTPLAPPPPAGAAAEPTRQVIDPADVLRQGSTAPLTPPVIQVDVEIDPRGVMTAEPLVPPVVQADVELAPRGATTPTTTEPLVPPVVEIPAEPAAR